MIQDLASLAAVDQFWTDPKMWTAMVALVVSLVTLVTTYRWTIRHKEFDVTMHFQEAWDDLEMLRSNVKSEDEARYWFGRYWNLQIRQFEYWLRGYIRDEIFIYWMHCRRQDYDARREFVAILEQGKIHPNYDYKRGWDEVKDDIVFKEHPYRFREFMDHVLTCDTGDDFSKYILESKEDLFGMFARLDRKTCECTQRDPRAAFRLRRRP